MFLKMFTFIFLMSIFKYYVCMDEEMKQMVKHLYLMRHGETLFNIRRKIQGWCDSPLTKTGINQAIAARAYLRDINFDHGYSSSSERCCDTLEIVTQNKLPYIRMKELRERGFGEFEGESENLNPKRGDSFDYDDLFPHYGGEYGYEVKERMSNTLKSIMEKKDHHNVLVVSSSGACFHFLSSVVGKEKVNKIGRLTNCCVLHFTYENGKFVLCDIIRPDVKDKKGGQ